LIFSDWIFFLV